MNVVIYARFSSHSQTEQSIEGQLKVCYEYAESNHYTVVGEYIDRAISGTTDNRVEFQRMISDSDKHTFEGVLVYQLDRFARNRYDSAINKAKLKKNGVRVLSAKENIADDASGILVEGVLESMAEYYSVELSQKIHRGMAINAEKCLSNGSNPGLGFKVDAERRFYVDEEEAAIVREIYERYASGETKAEIIRDLKRRRVKTSLGKEFSPNSLSHLLSNKRYIGVYLYKGKETPGGMPRILDDDLFYRVQSMMNKNKNAPARTHGEGEYLLTTKLFCGHCKEMMVGYGGTSKTGRQYHYYMCKNARRKKCGKKIVSKSYIEDRVVNECLKMLTEEKIRFIAKKVAEECAKSPDNLTAKALKKAIREADAAIENLWKAIEQGRAVEMLTERLNKRIAEKAELEAQLAVEENKKITLTEAQILAFLDYVCEMPADDVNKRRAIINIFVHSIYLYDDHFTLIINASKKPLSIDNIPLDDIETAFESETGASEGCSSLSTPAPPQTKSLYPQRIQGFCYICAALRCVSDQLNTLYHAALTKQQRILSVFHFRHKRLREPGVLHLLQIRFRVLPDTERPHLHTVQHLRQLHRLRRKVDLLVRRDVRHVEELTDGLAGLLGDGLHVVDEPLGLLRVIVEAELRQHGRHVGGAQLIEVVALHQPLRCAGRQRRDPVLDQPADLPALLRRIAMHPRPRHGAVEAVGVECHVEIGRPRVGLRHSVVHVAVLGVDDLKSAALQRILQIVGAASHLLLFVGGPAVPQSRAGVDVAGPVLRADEYLIAHSLRLLRLWLLQLRQAGQTGQQGQNTGQHSGAAHGDPVHFAEHRAGADGGHSGLRHGLEGADTRRLDPVFPNLNHIVPFPDIPSCPIVCAFPDPRYGDWPLLPARPSAPRIPPARRCAR